MHRRVQLLLLAVMAPLFGWLGLRALFTNAGTAKPHVARESPGEVLSIQRLQDNEKVVLVSTVSRRIDGADRVFQIQGGQPARISVQGHLQAGGESSPSIAPVSGILNREESVGLDAYLPFTRHYPGLGLPVSHRPDELLVGYYRDGRKIGEEKFTPISDIFPKPRLEQGKLLPPEDTSTVGTFPPEVFREIITPEFVEYRLREAPVPKISQERKYP